ncbi:hypothetical protein VTN02DRAFT_4622 [Thermoascus thermophilus]
MDGLPRCDFHDQGGAGRGLAWPQGLRHRIGIVETRGTRVSSWRPQDPIASQVPQPFSDLLTLSTKTESVKIGEMSVTATETSRENYGYN